MTIFIEKESTFRKVTPVVLLHIERLTMKYLYDVKNLKCLKTFT